MQHEFFRGHDMREAMGKVRASMGEDAMVLFSRSIDDGNGVSAEIAAAPAAVVDAFRLGLEWGSPEIKKPDPARLGPRFIALVGPPGAGKTLTGVKLALSEHAFAGNGVGFLTLDTYRVGAVDEQLSMWIDGKYAGDHKRPILYWDQPFAIDVTGRLTAGKHHFALRVHNGTAAGGVFKPVTVLAGPEVDAGNALAAAATRSAR